MEVILLLMVLTHCILILSLSRGKSYIDSPEWVKNKKATINPKTLSIMKNIKNVKY